jgi:hypothetical protein
VCGAQGECKNVRFIDRYNRAARGIEQGSSRGRCVQNVGRRNRTGQFQRQVCTEC